MESKSDGVFLADREELRWMEPPEWGRLAHSWLFGSCATVAAQPETYALWREMVKLLPQVLPCPSCSRHCKLYIAQHPLSDDPRMCVRWLARLRLTIRDRIRNDGEMSSTQAKLADQGLKENEAMIVERFQKRLRFPVLWVGDVLAFVACIMFVVTRWPNADLHRFLALVIQLSPIPLTLPPLPEQPFSGLDGALRWLFAAEFVTRRRASFVAMLTHFPVHTRMMSSVSSQMRLLPKARTLDNGFTTHGTAMPWVLCLEIAAYSAPVGPRWAAAPHPWGCEGLDVDTAGRSVHAGRNDVRGAISLSSLADLCADANEHGLPTGWSLHVNHARPMKCCNLFFGVALRSETTLQRFQMQHDVDWKDSILFARSDYGVKIYNQTSAFVVQPMDTIDTKLSPSPQATESTTILSFTIVRDVNHTRLNVRISGVGIFTLVDLPKDSDLSLWAPYIVFGSKRCSCKSPTITIDSVAQ